MTPAAYRAALDRLGWPQARFARLGGVSANTASRWASGEHPVPHWAELLLRLDSGTLERLEKPERLAA